MHQCRISLSTNIIMSCNTLDELLGTSGYQLHCVSCDKLSLVSQRGPFKTTSPNLFAGEVLIADDDNHISHTFLLPLASSDTPTTHAFVTTQNNTESLLVTTANAAENKKKRKMCNHFSDPNSVTVAEARKNLVIDIDGEIMSSPVPCKDAHFVNVAGGGLHQDHDTVIKDYEEVLQYNPYAKRMGKYPRPSRRTPAVPCSPIVTRGSTSGRMITKEPSHADGKNAAAATGVMRNLALEMENEVEQYNPYAKLIQRFPRPSQRRTRDYCPDQSPLPAPKIKRLNSPTVSSKGNDCNSKVNSTKDHLECSGIDKSSCDYGPVCYVAVDVETHDWGPKYSCRADYIGRIIQIGWVTYNTHGKKIDGQCHLIKPVGFEISRKAEKYHGITNETALQFGEDATMVLQQFVNLLKKILSLDDGGYVIAHNMKHEDCCFGGNLTPEQLRIWDRVPKVCTLTPRLLHLIKSDHYYCSPGLPRHQGMKLADLHRLLCGSSGGTELRSDAHNALADATMCGEVFFEFKKRIPEKELLWRRSVALGK